MLLTREQTENLMILIQILIRKYPLKVNQTVQINDSDYMCEISCAGRDKYLISFNCI